MIDKDQRSITNLSKSVPNNLYYNPGKMPAEELLNASKFSLYNMSFHYLKEINEFQLVITFRVGQKIAINNNHGKIGT